MKLILMLWVYAGIATLICLTAGCSWLPAEGELFAGYRRADTRQASEKAEKAQTIGCSWFGDCGEDKHDGK